MEVTVRMYHRRLGIACIAASVLAIGLVQTSTEQLSTRPAAEWVKTLDRPERLAGLNIDEVITRLRLKPGDVVADLGAGTGAFSVPFGKTVSPGGRVYAVDIDEGFFDFIKGKAMAEKVTNVEPVLGEFTDAKVPAQVDVAFFHDVLHHIEDRAGYLKNLAQYVKASGRVAIIDFDGEQGPHSAAPELRFTKDQVTMWMAAAGFSPAEEHFDVFEEKFFVVYTRQ